MKQKFLTVCVLLFAISLQSCKKDKVINNTYYSNCKVNRFYYGDFEKKFTYNADGKIEKIEELDLNNNYSYTTYSYSSFSATYEYKIGRSKKQGNFVLDANGRALSSIILFYSDFDSTKVINKIFSVYKYNAEGNLIEKNDSSGTQNYQRKYTWFNGNLISLIAFYKYNDNWTIAGNTNYEYFTDKLNALGKTKELSDFTGVSSKNLLKAEVDGNDGTQKVVYTYEFDSNGKPTKIISNEMERWIELTCP